MPMHVKLGIMLTDNSLLTLLRDELSEPIFEMFDFEFYLNVIYNSSLNTYSSYYPAVLEEGIRVTADMGIPEINPATGATSIFRYKIPNYNPTLYQYTDIHDYYVPGNDIHGSYRFRSSQPNLHVNAMVDQLASLIPHVNNRFTVTFEFPHYVRVSPPFKEHVDFVVLMRYRKNLSQIPFGHFELFTGLVVCDVKLKIYNLLPNLRNNANFGGMEIESVIASFENAKSERQEIIEQFEKDWFLDPIQYGVATLYNKR